MMRNTRCMGVLRLIMLPFRLDELRGEPPLELVAVEALHVVGLLEKAQRWVGRVQSVGRIETSTADRGGEKSSAKQKQFLFFLLDFLRKHGRAKLNKNFKGRTFLPLFQRKS